MLTRRDMNRIKEDQKALEINKKIEELQKQKEHLENQCRLAGRTMIELNLKYESSLKQVEELKANLARAKEDHQYDKMVHEKELKDLTKK